MRQEGKCQVYDPAPLVLVKDIMTYMPQIKYMFSNLASEQPASNLVDIGGFRARAAPRWWPSGVGDTRAATRLCRAGRRS